MKLEKNIRLNHKLGMKKDHPNSELRQVHMYVSTVYNKLYMSAFRAIKASKSCSWALLVERDHRLRHGQNFTGGVFEAAILQSENIKYGNSKGRPAKERHLSLHICTTPSSSIWMFS